MRVFVHVVSGVALAAASLGSGLGGPAEAIGLFGVSVLLDVDHFIDYAVRFHNPSLARAVRFFEERHDVKRVSLCAFHTIEFVAVAGLMASFSRFLTVLFVGVVVHLARDFFQGIYHRRLSYRWWSVAHYLSAGGQQ